MWCSSTRGRARLVERLRWTAGSGKKGQFKVNLSQVHSPWSPLHVCVEHVERPASTQDTFTPPFVPPPPFTLTGRLKTPQTALTTKLLKGLRHEEIATWLCNSAFTTHLGITNHIRLRQSTGRSERKPSKVRTLAPTSAHQTCVFTLTFALRVLFLELSLDDSLARIPIAGSRVSLAASLRSRSCVLLDESLSSDLHRRPRPCPTSATDLRSRIPIPAVADDHDNQVDSDPKSDSVLPEPPSNIPPGQHHSQQSSELQSQQRLASQIRNATIDVGRAQTVRIEDEIPPVEELEDLGGVHLYHALLVEWYDVYWRDYNKEESEFWQKAERMEVGDAKRSFAQLDERYKRRLANVDQDLLADMKKRMTEKGGSDTVPGAMVVE